MACWEHTLTAVCICRFGNGDNREVLGPAWAPGSGAAPTVLWVKAAHLGPWLAVSRAPGSGMGTALANRGQAPVGVGSRAEAGLCIPGQAVWPESQALLPSLEPGL